MGLLINNEDFQEFWELNPIVVLDSCSVLDLYRYSSSTTNTILENFEKIIENIWLPAHVLLEYSENKEEVTKQAYNKYKNVTEDVKSIISSTSADISKRFIRYGKFKFPNISSFKAEIDKKLHELLQESDKFKNIVADEIEENRKVLLADDVNSFIEGLERENKVGPALTIPELISIYHEGEQRYNYLIPPGYKDSEKDKKDKTKTKKFGDLIIWKELLKKASNTNQPFIFITDDEKEDWWELSTKNELLGARKELVSEFEQHALFKNNGFLMLTLTQFNNHISRIYNTESHQSYIEMNLDKIVSDVINQNEWVLILNGDMQLTHSFINDGYLENMVDYVLTDVEINHISDPIFDELYVDFEENSVYINGTFKCNVEAEIESSLSKHYSETESGKISISGRILIDLSIDYEKTEDFFDPGESSIEIEWIEIESCLLTKFYDYEEIECISCHKKPGNYFTREGEPVCEDCLTKFDSCIECGKLFEIGTLLDNYCEDCIQIIHN